MKAPTQPWEWDLVAAKYSPLRGVAKILPKKYWNAFLCGYINADFGSLKSFEFPEATNAGILARHICEVLRDDHSRTA